MALNRYTPCEPDEFGNPGFCPYSDNAYPDCEQCAWQYNDAQENHYDYEEEAIMAKTVLEELQEIIDEAGKKFVDGMKNDMEREQKQNKAYPNHATDRYTNIYNRVAVNYVPAKILFEIPVDKFKNLVCNVKAYDIFTMYIDSYKQQVSAEAANDAIAINFVETCKYASMNVKDSSCAMLASRTNQVGCSITAEDAVAEFINNYFKEENTMAKSANTKSNSNKEEETMTIINAKANAKEEVMKYLEGMTVKQLKDVAVIVDVKFNSKIRKAELIKLITESGKVIPTEEHVVSADSKEGQEILKQQAQIQEQVIEVQVGDMSKDRMVIDNTVIEKKVKTVVTQKTEAQPVNTAKAKTDKMFALIKKGAEANEKKGFGYTVSAKMLCAYIIEADTMFDAEPINRLYISTGKKNQYGKDITQVNPKVTDAHKESCKKVRNWLIQKGFIKVATFSDEAGHIFYTDEYNGKNQAKLCNGTATVTGKTSATSYRICLQ